REGEPEELLTPQAGDDGARDVEHPRAVDHHHPEGGEREDDGEENRVAERDRAASLHPRKHPFNGRRRRAAARRLALPPRCVGSITRRSCTPRALPPPRPPRTAPSTATPAGGSPRQNRRSPGFRGTGSCRIPICRRTDRAPAGCSCLP